VIVANEKGLVPSVNTLIECRDANPDGIGIAWQTKRGIRFEKGITFSWMLRCLETIAKHQMAYVLHFRIRTIGGQGDKYCHPWPITSNRKQLFKLTGCVKGVLAHNGTWSDWDESFHSQDLIQYIEDSKWSDSAVMAWLLGKGRNIDVPKFAQRIVTLDVTNGLRFFGDFQQEGGISYSNLYFKTDWASWSKWQSSEDGKYLAGEPTVSLQDATACDIESLRRSKKLSNRAANKMKRKIEAANRYAKRYGSVIGNAMGSQYIDTSSNLKPYRATVYCENCGNEFSSGVFKCPFCHVGEGTYKEPDQINGVAINANSLACYNLMHEKCLLKSCKCSCHNDKAWGDVAVSDECCDSKHIECAGCKCDCHPSMVASHADTKYEMMYCLNCGLWTNLRPCPKCTKYVFSSKPKAVATDAITNDKQTCIHDVALSEPCESCFAGTPLGKQVQAIKEGKAQSTSNVATYPNNIVPAHIRAAVSASGYSHWGTAAYAPYVRETQTITPIDAPSVANVESKPEASETDNQSTEMKTDEAQQA
jgi:hypothetical protein